MTTERSAAGNAAKLDRAAQLIRESVHTTREAISQMPRIPESKQAAQTALRASSLGWDALGDLIAAGATVLDFERRNDAESSALDLSSLSALDTPDVRSLLSLLEIAQSIAERVDESRGRAVAASVSLQPGESRGTDIAEAISVIALRLRVDVYGPSGRD